jgi:gluconate kinase
MLVYLFGLPAAGKNYVGELLAEAFGFFFHDADCDLTADMHEAIRLGQPFTEAMRDRFYDVVIERIEALTAVHANVAVAQATFKEKHRNRILERFPEALMILVEADEAVRVQRLQRGNNLITADYALQIAKLYEPPLCACAVLENNDGPEAVVAQLGELLAGQNNNRMNAEKRSSQ